MNYLSGGASRIIRVNNQILNDSQLTDEDKAALKT